MTIEQQIQAIKLDDYKDRTGDYSATKIPTFRDFVPIGVPKQIPYPATIAKYGLSRFDYWRLAAKQNYRCAICGEPTGRIALHLDHCHKSNKVRGLICHHCNIAIGMMKDDPATARAIADYLEKHAA